jgi:hypothetical protein
LIQLAASVIEADHQAEAATPWFGLTKHWGVVAQMPCSLPIRSLDELDPGPGQKVPSIRHDCQSYSSTARQLTKMQKVEQAVEKPVRNRGLWLDLCLDHSIAVPEQELVVGDRLGSHTGRLASKIEHETRRIMSDTVIHCFTLIGETAQTLNSPLASIG